VHRKGKQQSRSSFQSNSGKFNLPATRQLDDIRARGEGTINYARGQIRNEKAVTDFVDNDIEEPTGVPFSQEQDQKSSEDSQKGTTFSRLHQKNQQHNSTKAIGKAARSKRCIERKNDKAEADTDRTQ